MINPDEISYLPSSPGVTCFWIKWCCYLCWKSQEFKNECLVIFKKDHDPKTTILITKIKNRFYCSENEVEALLLENNLIKILSSFQFDLKDSRRYAYIRLVEGDIPYF